METNNSTSSKTKVFFYGTLKRGQPNYDHTESNRCEFVCEAVTVDKWPLIIGTQFNVPFMLNKKGHGKNIHGEIYWIDEKAREFFDLFEEGYAALSIDVRDKTTGELHTCVSYMLENFRDDLLNGSRVFLDNYSSKNEFYPEYQKKLDTTIDREAVAKRKNAYNDLKN